MTEKLSAISYVSRQLYGQTVLLVVWNKRYKVWCLPGGKVEPGETPEEAQRRELLEETGVETVTSKHVYSAPSSNDTGRIVHVFKVTISGQPYEVEAGCPVTWMTEDDLLKGPHFTPFYEHLFASGVLNAEPTGS